MRSEWPRRGEVWDVELGSTRGHEQAGRRPALVLSTNRFNSGPTGLVIVVPLTTRDRRQPLHVRIEPPEAGLRRRSYVKCEDVRSISIERLARRRGLAEPKTVAAAAARIRLLVGA
jgi:mRNA interferase MazF